MRFQEAVAKLDQTPPADLAAAVDFLVHEAAALTKSTLAYFAVMNGPEDVLTMIGWSKTAMDACAMMDKPIVYPIEKTGLWGDCVRERAPVVTNDYAASTRPTKKGYPEGHVQVVRHLNVCMMDGDHVAGVLGVGNKTDDYTDVDVRELQAFANACWKHLPQEELKEILA